MAETGTVLDGRYRVDAVLAKGGMSTVYTGTDLRLDREVAIKVMAAELARDPAFVESFRREAKAAAKLSHRGVVSVFDQGEDAGTVFLVMELVRGTTLRDLLRERGKLPPALAVSIMDSVLAALAAAHRAGFVHRDVKPENVLLAEDGSVKVADFGLAKAVASNTAVKPDVVMGTVAYVAPEQVTNSTVDQRADVYSAGIVLYELLTGCPPYTGEKPVSVAYRHVHQDVPAPSRAGARIPAALDDLVVRATRRAPGGRPPNAGAFLTELRTAARQSGIGGAPVSAGPGNGQPAPVRHQPTRALTVGHPVPPPPVRRPPAVFRPPPPPPPPRKNRRGLVVTLVVLLLAGLAGGAGWWYGAGRYISVPDLAGMSQNDAERTAREADLTVRGTRTAFDDRIESGKVVGTEPRSGHRIPRGGELTLILSKGPRPLTVPDLAGRSPDDAIAALDELDLGHETVDAYSNDVDEGQVAGTDPAVDTELEPGDTVTLLISQGPLPDVTGQSQGDAEDALDDANLNADVVEDYSDDVPEGTVISQDPSGGTVAEGSTITLTVSKGPTPVTVPLVIGDSLTDATDTLEDLGLSVDSSSILGRDDGTVIGQDPVSGTEVDPGSTVTLSVL